MAEGDYEYEKMRCELLGLPPPEQKPDAPEDGSEEVKVAEDDEGVNESVSASGEERLDPNQKLEIDNEQLKHVSGGLDELNNILSVTQKKLNKFKVVCGSLTNLLKIKVGTTKSDEASSSNNESQVATDTEEEPGKEVAGGGENIKRKAPKPQQQVDTSEMMDSQIDKLDSLIMKAEQAHLSMSSQNKQMRIFLRK